MIRAMKTILVTAAVITLGAMAATYATAREGANPEEIAAALAAKTTLTQAIASAEQQTVGQAIKIRFEDRHGSPKYEVKVITKEDKLSEVSIDPTSGKVLRAESEELFSQLFNHGEVSEAAKLKGGKITLASAVAAAEQQLGGRAIEAGYENENDRSQFHVVVARDHAVSEVKVDSNTGKVVKIEAAGDSKKGNGTRDDD